MDQEKEGHTQSEMAQGAQMPPQSEITQEAQLPPRSETPQMAQAQPLLPPQPEKIQDSVAQHQPTNSKKKKNRGTFLKPLLIGLAGGVIALAGGVGYLAMSGNDIGTTLGGATISKVNGNTSTDTTRAIQQVSNAVVSVLNYQSGSSASSILGGFSNGSSSGLQLTSEGSGVIYKREGDTAYIVTNDHVIAGESQLEVLLAGGQKVTATVVGSDTYSDLAVLKISAQNVKQVATFGDSSKVQVGETAIAVGSPLGSQYANSATEGIISALSRQVTMQNDQNQTISVNALQTDAAINPGNSGGALININGQVIGITSSKITTAENGSTSVEGMGFAIPSDDVVSLISKLEKGETIQRPALGIGMVNLTDLTSSQISSLNLPSSVTAGVYVSSTQSGFPAQTAGIQQGDVITKIDSTAISTTTDLQTSLYKYNIGDTVSITFYRGSTQHTVSVKLTQSSANLNIGNSSNN